MTLKQLLPSNLTQRTIAEHCDVKQQSVHVWIKTDVVPAKRAKAFSEVTGIDLGKCNPIFA